MYIRAAFARSIAKNRANRNVDHPLDYICAFIKFLAEFGHTHTMIEYPGEAILKELESLGYVISINDKDNVHISWGSK